MKRISMVVSLMSLFAFSLAAQQAAKPTLRELTLEAIFDPKDKVAFAGAPQSGVVWTDGKSVAFIRGNNLYVVNMATQKEPQLTKDGGDEVFNGSLDWVYQEEVYGRGNFHAYWWSPDSKHLAFLRLDEKPVKRFTIVDQIPTMQKVEQQPYPKAGFPNPIARLFTVEASGGAPREIDTKQYSDFLLVKVDWTPDSAHVVYQVQSREQTWLDVDSAAFDGTGTPRTLFRESTKAWIEPSGNPTWLNDGSFLWGSERSGFKNVYHYDASGKLVRQVPSDTRG